MKLSISLPDEIAKEIRQLSKSTNRSISYWLKRAWIDARKNLNDPKEDGRREQEALSYLRATEGSLKADFPGHSSVGLQKQAFKKKK